MRARPSCEVRPEDELPAEVSIVHRRVAEPAARQQGIAGDHAHTLPAQAPVQAFGFASGDGIEHQQRLAAFASRGFGGSDQRCPSP